MEPDRAAQADGSRSASPRPAAARPWDERLREELVAAAVRQHARRTCHRRRRPPPGTGHNS